MKLHSKCPHVNMLVSSGFVNKNKSTISIEINAMIIN